MESNQGSAAQGILSLLLLPLHQEPKDLRPGSLSEPQPALEPAAQAEPGTQSVHEPQPRRSPRLLQPLPQVKEAGQLSVGFIPGPQTQVGPGQAAGVQTRYTNRPSMPCQRVRMMIPTSSPWGLEAKMKLWRMTRMAAGKNKMAMDLLRLTWTHWTMSLNQKAVFCILCNCLY